MVVTQCAAISARTLLYHWTVGRDHVAHLPRCAATSTAHVTSLGTHSIHALHQHFWSRHPAVGPSPNLVSMPSVHNSQGSRTSDAHCRARPNICCQQSGDPCRKSIIAGSAGRVCLCSAHVISQFGRPIDGLATRTRNLRRPPTSRISIRTHCNRT